MKRRTIIAWLGFLVIVVPFMGVPIQWKEYALIVLGVLVIVVSLAHGRKRITEKSDSTYVENKNTPSEIR